MKITYRDKIFLLAVVAILTLVISYMTLIKPEMEKIETNEASVASAQSEKDDIDSKIAQIPAIKKQIETKIEESKDLSGVFLEPTPTHRADVFIQELLDKNGIVFSEIDISEALLLDLAPYTYHPSVSAFDQSSDEEPNATPPVNTDISTQMLPAYTIDVSYRAYQEGLETFLNDTNEMEDMSVVISDLMWQTESDLTKVLEYDADTNTTVHAPLADGLISGTMTINVYYVNPIEKTLESLTSEE